MAVIDERGSFYLGRRHELSAAQKDVAAAKTDAEPLLYDSADLTTHAVCVGMTGSGKTGLCLALLEEAALDGVPAIAIDPKGDLGNLLLAFPELRPADFRPWIDESVAARDGISPDDLAAKTAESWRNGLSQWGEDGERIRRFKEAVDCAIYTPGSSAGLPLTVLKSFNAPPQAVLDDADAFGDRVQAAASGVLALLGINADPVNSREHILLSRVLSEAWRAGRTLSIEGLVHEIQKPAFSKVGAVPLDNFMSAKDRDALAMQMNNLLAAPSFASWLEGEPLDVQRLLNTAEGKPRLSIISIAHLNDQERMFFVTLLLNEVISWMRSQPGTSSLRAILYMDEVFGYFPPSANPPAKKPMLTLLKQARAYGVGCVLATQNPVDLDYKGLSNAGTWFLGRLQTERDKLRVLEGLEGASADAGASFDRGKMEQTLAGLGKRVFLMNNVHEPAPTVFQSRWALSYLAGPLTRRQIATLMGPRKGAAKATWEEKEEPDAKPRAAARVESVAVSVGTGRPLLSGEVTQRFFSVDDPAEGGSILYRPALLGLGRMHFVKADEQLDVWRDAAALQAIDGDLSQAPWERATMLAAKPELEDEPHGGATFGDLPGALGQKKTYTSLKRELDDWLYQTQRYVRFACAEVGESSKPDEDEKAFRVRVAPLLQADRKARAIERRAAEVARLEKELEQAAIDRGAHRWWFVSLVFNVGSRVAEILLMGLLNRRSRKQVMTAGIWNSAMKQRRMAAQAKQIVKEKQAALEKLAHDEQDELQRLDAPLPPASVPVEKTDVAPRKSDVDVDEVMLVWLPWRVATDGRQSAAYKLP